MKWLACALLIVLAEAACNRSAESYLQRGNALFRAGKYTEAELEYRAALAKTPRLAEGYYRFARTEIQLHRGAAALQALRKAADLEPNNDEYGIELADVSLQAYQADASDKRSYDQVAKEAYDLLRKNPNSFDGLRLRGNLLIIDRKYDEALAELRRADAIRPLDPGANVPMVQALFTQNRTQEGEGLAARVLKAHRDSAAMYDLLVAHYLDQHRTAEAEQLLEAEVAGLPNDLGPRLALAELYQKSGRRQEMAVTLENIRKDRARFPNAPGVVGDFYANAGEWDEALRQYQDGERSDPEDRPLYQKGIARALAALGRQDAAIVELNGVLKAHPEDRDARMTRAMLLRSSAKGEDRALAIAELKDLSDRAPTDAVTRYNLGLAYLGNGDQKAAITELKKSAGVDPDYAAPRLALAELAERAGDHTETVQLTEQILAKDADNDEATLLHAAGLIGAQDYPRARAELESMLTRQPDSMDANLCLAALDTAEQKYTNAEARYRRVYQPGSDDVRPIQGLLQLYLKENQPAKADALLQQELRKDPASAQVHLLAASTAMGEGKRALAIQHYEWVRANDSSEMEALKSLGDLYHAEGDIPRAIANYERASELAPRDEDVLNSLALLENEAGDLQGAIATLKKQLALNPQDAAVMNNLAFDLAESGTDLTQALTLAATAARQLSDDPGVMDTLGWVYAKTGLNQSAIQVFRMLVNKNPDHPVYRYHLGVAFLQDHKPTEAKSEFTIALTQKPSKELAQKIQQMNTRL